MEKVIQTKKQIVIINILKYALFFAIMCIFSIAGIKSQIYPFLPAFYIALCWCDQDIYVVSLFYIIAGLLNPFTFLNLFQLLCSAFIVVICFLIHKKANKKIPLWLVGLYFVLSQILRSYFSFSSVNDIVPIVVTMFLGLLFLYACINIFRVLLVKKIGLKLTIDEKICLASFFAIIGTGLSSIDIFGFSLANVFAVFVILICTYVFDKSIPIIFAVSFGLGIALKSGEVTNLATYVCMALASITFRTNGKYFSVLSILLIDVVVGLYLNGYPNYSYKILISTILGEILFLCVSNSKIEMLKTYFYQKSSENALKNMVNRSRDNLCKKMYSLSEIFAEMDRSFKSTVKGTLPASEAKQMLKDDVYQKICANCPQKHHCHRVIQNQTEEIFNGILSAGISRGKVTMLDIPPLFSTRCNQTGIILNYINQLLANYKQYTYFSSSVDMSRALVADEFGGVSKLLQKLANDTKELVEFNQDLEQKITDDLAYINIMATEVFAYQSNGEILCTITLRTIDIENEKLISVLNKNFGTKMQIVSIQPSNHQNFVVVTFGVSPKYDCIFGSSGTNKFGFTTSGDSYTFIKLDNNKIMLSICDGMGSGEDAQKTSDTTISLIENFYRANFDEQTVLSSVNRLLSMQMTDNYTAVDVATIDLSNATCDIIKVGSPACFIKSGEETEKISGTGSLPVGILETIEPSVNKRMLNPNDIVILMSDGVVDAFDNDEKLKVYINNITSQNPQEICDQILQKALLLDDGQAKDDMTVLATRIFVNI